MSSSEVAFTTELPSRSSQNFYSTQINPEKKAASDKMASRAELPSSPRESFDHIRLTPDLILYDEYIFKLLFTDDIRQKIEEHVSIYSVQPINVKFLTACNFSENEITHIMEHQQDFPKDILKNLINDDFGPTQERMLIMKADTFAHRWENLAYHLNSSKVQQIQRHIQMSKDVTQILCH